MRWYFLLIDGWKLSFEDCYANWIQGLLEFRFMRLLPILNIEIVLVFEALLSGIRNPKNLPDLVSWRITRHCIPPQTHNITRASLYSTT